MRTINPQKQFNTLIGKWLTHLRNITLHNQITQGTAIHSHLIKNGVSTENYIATKLLVMYLNNRRSKEANEILKDFNGFNLVAHNCLINAYVQWGKLDEARKLFDEMPQRNEVSWTMLISGFMKHGRLEDSMFYFSKNPFHNVYTWTAAISGFVQNGYSFQALKLFLIMLDSGVEPNEATFTSVMRGCVDLGDFELGLGFFGLIVKAGFGKNVSVCNSLISFCLKMGEIDFARRLFDGMEERDVVSWTIILDMYVEMGDLVEARRIFDEMPERNEITWSAMISRYIQRNCFEEGLEMFRGMVQDGFKPNTSCFATVVSALARFKALLPGMSIHGHAVKIGVEADVFVSSCLVDLYSKCGKTRDGRLMFDNIKGKNVVSWNSMIGGYCISGKMEDAVKLFNVMPQRNDVSWNTIISGYVEHEQFDKVFEVFNAMLLSGLIPSKSTFSSMLRASTGIASLDKGKDLHGKAIKHGFASDVFIGTALTDMYAKSGDIVSAKKIFDRMPEKNEVSWTAMIQGLADSGFVEESLDLFEKMEKTSIPPNDLVLVSVLFACSHSGLVDKGLQYFNTMETVYGLKPKEKHYTCAVDMLSRAGRLSEAENFINSMPFEPKGSTWAALLSGCKTYKNDEIAERTAKKLMELAEEKPSGYVLLSNIYASAGRWADVMNVRKLMREKGVKKSGGCSWIELRNQVHTFYSHGTTDPESAELFGVMELLRSEMLSSDMT